MPASGRTKAKVTPLNSAGTVVDFGVDASAKSIIVHFVDAKGKDIPPGTEGFVNDGRFVVGYDGEAYFTGLSAQNVVKLQTAAADCSATVNIDPAKLMQRIGPVYCR